MSVTVDRTTQRYSSGPQATPRMILLHTTEGWGWPPYQGGASAPHATIWPLPGVGINVREHRRWTDYGKALRNESGGVETNTSGVIQFEMVGTCYSGGPGYRWYQPDPVVLAALADYFRPIAAQFRIPNRTLPFVAYPSSYGNTGTRMTNSEWVRFAGWCGHQHAPENSHGDPGAFPISTLLHLVYTSTPAPEDDMPYTEAQLKEYAGVGAVSQQIGRATTTDSSGRTIPLTVGIVLDRVYDGVAAQRQQISALTVAVAALTAKVDALTVAHTPA